MPFSIEWSRQSINDVLPSIEYYAQLLQQSFTQLSISFGGKGKAIYNGSIDGIEYRTVLIGSDMVYSKLTGERVLSGGDVESIRMGRVEGGNFVPLVFSEGKTFQGSDIFVAARDEKNNTDTSAIEDLIINAGVRYNGTDLKDIFLKGAMNNDGSALNLSGQDRVDLQGGDDTFFLGRGNDFALGGSGDDSLTGGLGNDRLFGQSGRDKLIGNAGKDRLFGGGGNDKLFGGTGDDILKGGLGHDRLFGGRGNDLLSGAAGKDVFLFRDGTGDDQIDDYQIGLDRLKITTANEILVTDQAEGLLLSWGDGSVLVIGIHQEADITLI